MCASGRVRDSSGKHFDRVYSDMPTHHNRETKDLPWVGTEYPGRDRQEAFTELITLHRSAG